MGIQVPRPFESVCRPSSSCQGCKSHSLVIVTDIPCRKRIFILHPSHHHHLSTAALPTLKTYETPLDSSPLPLDHETIYHHSSLTPTTSQNRNIKFDRMSSEVDEAEHSCEMQLPYLHRLLQLQHPGDPTSSYPPLIPIMIGSTNSPTEVALGSILAPYIADPTNVFIISSDFCHWGCRFNYTYSTPPHPRSPRSPYPMESSNIRPNHSMPTTITYMKTLFSRTVSRCTPVLNPRPLPPPSTKAFRTWTEHVCLPSPRGSTNGSLECSVKPETRSADDIQSVCSWLVRLRRD